MKKLEIPFLVIAFVLSISIIWSWQHEMNHGELFRCAALLFLGTVLLIYSIRKKVNDAFDQSRKIGGILFGVITVILGLDELFSYLYLK